MKHAPAYCKYLYWLDPALHAGAIEELRRDRRSVYRVREQPCEALYPRRDLTLVEPRAWDLRCRRQGSWYRTSPRQGDSLLVAGSPRKDLSLWGIITLEPFRPPRTATEQDVLEMTADPRVPEILPLGWGDFSPWEEQAIRQYLKGQGLDRSLQEVFLCYTANHLNFIFPRFFIGNGQHPVIPYSIHGTPLVCSACVELFGIVGKEFGVKYLVPCPGLKYISPALGECIRLVIEP